MLCLLCCGLLAMLWIRSYWTFDIFKWRLADTTGLQCASVDGQLLIVTFPTRTALEWSWTSTTDARIDDSQKYDARYALLQYTREILALQKQASQSTRGKSYNTSRLEAQIKQKDLQIESYREHLKESVFADLWAHPNEPRPQPLGDLPWLSRRVPNRWGFGGKQIATGWAIASPHWCPVLISGAMAVALGIRRSWRFSLRTLIAAMTVVAIVFGLITGF
jgi:hypothetical protein